MGLDITPRVNLLKSVRGERIDYLLLIGEGVDNSFDADAREVRITVASDEISFQDNGVGITRDRIAAVVSLGDHGRMASTQLGRFGVGIKMQAINAGDVLQVVSTSGEGRVNLRVDWRKVLRSGEWIIDDPRWQPVPVGASSGTIITVSALRKPPRVGLDKIRQEVALRFYPALAHDRAIYLNGSPVEAMPEPRMTDVIDLQLSLAGDRTAHLRAGILAQPSKLNRVHVAYRHRVIMPESTLGCGEYGGLTKMFARLQLSGQWHFAKFKNDLTDEGEREELEEAVLKALTPILEKCNSASLSARVTEMSHLINELVPPEFAPARPRPQQKDRAQPTGRSNGQSGNVSAAKSDLGGPAKAKRPPQCKLLITFDGIAKEDGVGAYQQQGKLHRVNLSKDDPYVAHLMEHRDRDIGVRSLYAMAIAIFEQGRQEEDPELPYDEFKYGLRVARLLAIQDRTHEEVRA